MSRKLRIEDGRIYDEAGREVFELTGLELDGLIVGLYPSLLTMAETRKKQTSWSGWGWDNFDAVIEKKDPTAVLGTCETADSCYRLGGVRLLTLYCNRMDFFASANDLNMSHWTLRKWFERWKKKAIADGITPEDLGMRALVL